MWIAVSDPSSALGAWGWINSLSPRQGCEEVIIHGALHCLLLGSRVMVLGVFRRRGEALVDGFIARLDTLPADSVLDRRSVV